MLGRGGSWVGNTVGGLNLGRVWLYQDFVAGSGPNLTLSDNNNGTGLSFDSSLVVNSSAVVTKTNGNPIFTNTAELPSQLVSVSAHTGTSVTLDSTPAAGEGTVRVWYLYTMSADMMPSDAEAAPRFVKEVRSQFLDSRFLNADLSLSDILSASSGRTNLGFTTSTAGRVLIGDGSSVPATTSLLFWDSGNARLGVNQASPGAGATLDVAGVTGGIGLPVLTTTERDAITPARNGVVIYNSTTHSFHGYINGAWTAGLGKGTAHSSLSSLTSGDDHTQYFLLAGRSGGTTAIGGTGSGDNLVLQSSSNGTPGSVVIANQASEKARIGPTGSTSAWNNPQHFMVANSSSLTNGFVFQENSANWPATIAATGPQGMQILPKDNGGSFVIKISGANNQSFLKHINAADATSTGYFSMGLPWGFMNGNSALTTFKVSGTTGQSVDLVQYSNQSDFANTVSSIGKDGHFRAPVGTEALPGQSFHTDTNTGMYGDGSDALYWSTNATRRMSLNSSGLLLGVSGTRTGALLFGGATSGTVTLTCAAAAGTWSMTLPTGAGSSGQFLQTDGAGATSWATVPTQKAGSTSIASGATSKAISFATTFGSTNYAVRAQLINPTDTDPIHVPVLIIAKAATGFTAEWGDALPTANYSLEWSIVGFYDP